MDKLDKILYQSLAKKGLANTAKSASVCFFADKWGNGLFKSISFAKGVLKVSVESAPAASELQIQTNDLIDFLNSKMKRNVVRQVRIINQS